MHLFSNQLLLNVSIIIDDNCHEDDDDVDDCVFDNGNDNYDQ